MFNDYSFFLKKLRTYLYNIKIKQNLNMKKTTKLFAAFFGLVLFASACAQRTCPTYAEVETQQNQQIEATV
jgi:hypothetical protein